MILDIESQKFECVDFWPKMQYVKNHQRKKNIAELTLYLFIPFFPVYCWLL